MQQWLASTNGESSGKEWSRVELLLETDLSRKCISYVVTRARFIIFSFRFVGSRWTKINWSSWTSFHRTAIRESRGDERSQRTNRSRSSESDVFTLFYFGMLQLLSTRRIWSIVLHLILMDQTEASKPDRTEEMQVMHFCHSMQACSNWIERYCIDWQQDDSSPRDPKQGK